jgi:LacI family transcriptional regulator
MNSETVPLPSSSQKVTIADIANASGVCPATVSLALRSRPGVSSETRQRVLDNAQRLGYRFKLPHQAQSQSSLNSIGLVVKSGPGEIPLANDFYAPVLAGIETACRQKQISLLYATMLVDEENRPIDLPPLLTQQGVDGLLLVGASLDDATNAALQRSRVPVVLVDAYAANDPYDAVVSANVEGACQIVTYLIEKGHRHIGIVGSHPCAYPSILERRQGYLCTLEEHNLSPYFADCPLSLSEAYLAATRLLNQSPQITAIFGCNDSVAFAVMRAAQDMERKIPDALSVVGFDNVALAQHILPPLTTIQVDKVGMGRLAVQLLADRVEFPEAEKVRITVRPRLIERLSVQRLE